MRLAFLCFRTAIVFALIGFGLGLYMGLARDFSFTPAHAHINLLGWVSFFLYGAFYALVPSAAEGRLPRLHYGLALLGASVMTAGITAIINGMSTAVPSAVVGAFTVYGGLVTFALVVFRARATAMS